MIFLINLFSEFCKNFEQKFKERKLKWENVKGEVWTKTIFEVFSKIKPNGLVAPVGEYMRIDYIWRYDYPTKYQVHGIELAVEHESQENKIEELIDNEVQHLIDVRAKNKIAIFYPSLGDEERLIAEISKRIKSHQDTHFF